MSDTETSPAVRAMRQENLKSLYEVSKINAEVHKYIDWDRFSVLCTESGLHYDKRLGMLLTRDVWESIKPVLKEVVDG